MIPRSTQIWWEVWIRFAPNWYAAHSFDGNQPNAWYKFLLTGPASEGGRFDYELNYNCTQASVASRAPGPRRDARSVGSFPQSTCKDGAWHRFRGTMKVATSGGVYKLWVDDAVILNWTGNTQGTGPLETWGTLNPANANRGWKYVPGWTLG